MNPPIILFNNPYSLLLLIPLAIYLYYLFRRTTSARNVLKNIYYSSRRSGVLSLLKIIIPLLLIIASAEPVFIVNKTIYIDTVNDLRKYSGEFPVNYVVLIDVSPSMFRGGGIGRAVDAVETIISSMNKSDRIILAVFGGTVAKIYEGMNKEKALICLTNISRYRINYTGIGNALSWAYSYVHSSPIPSIIFIISDGAQNYGPDPLQVLDSMRSNKSYVVFIDTGSDPRGKTLYARLVSKDYKVLDISSLSTRDIKKIVENTVYESKLEVLKFSGHIAVVVSEEKNTPTILLLAASLAIYLLTRIEGV